MPPLLKILAPPTIRHYCTLIKPSRNVAKSIYLSKCTDIFTNLALEDWLYKNMDFSNHHLLMLWQNQPCVVIGRHQNPWLECNFAMLPHIANGAKLARRNSGGGTVYHDLRNLNLTFFTSRGEYNRKKNLELISRALKKSFNIISEINKREDLCIKDFKISGTASKLGRTSAYHHCTILVDSNKDDLSLALKHTLGGNVKTNASRSVKSKIMNLSEEKPGITVDEVLKAVIKEFDSKSIENEVFNSDLGVIEEENYLKEVRVIDTIDDSDFPGISDIRNTFVSTEWRFEKTPKFEIFRNIAPTDFTGNNSTNIVDSESLVVFLTMENGRVSDAGLRSDKTSLSVVGGNLNNFEDIFSSLLGKMFSKDVLDEFEMVVSGLKNSESCRTMMLNIN